MKVGVLFKNSSLLVSVPIKHVLVNKKRPGRALNFNKNIIVYANSISFYFDIALIIEGDIIYYFIFISNEY